jgi:hypothetical protein
LRRDHRLIFPTGNNRDGVGRAASLESDARVSDGVSGRCVQQRACLPDGSRTPGLNPSSNRRMRTRTYGGVGAGRGNPPGYPITPGMAIDLWGESPLHENEVLKEGSLPTVTPIEQVLEARNCGRATDRGKEATPQSCEVTDRNPIQGRWGSASEPTIAKPSSFVRIGKSGACAAKANRLIQGGPSGVPATRACPQAGPASGNRRRAGRKSAEAVVLPRRTPATPGRAEP